VRESCEERSDGERSSGEAKKGYKRKGTRKDLPRWVGPTAQVFDRLPPPSADLFFLFLSFAFLLRFAGASLTRPTAGQPFFSLSFPISMVGQGFVIQTMEKKGKERVKGCPAPVGRMYASLVQSLFVGWIGRQEHFGYASASELPPNGQRPSNPRRLRPEQDFGSEALSGACPGVR
jgi:hypothetical protein